MSIGKRIKRKQQLEVKKRDKKLMNAMRKEDIENTDFKAEMESAISEINETLENATKQEAILKTIVNSIKVDNYEGNVKKIMQEKREATSKLLNKLLVVKARTELSRNMLAPLVKEIVNNDDDTIVEPTSIFFEMQEGLAELTNIFSDISVMLSNDMDRG
jgi:glutamate mutase epsilon subunit